MRNVLTELRRRNVFRVGAAYVVVAWLLIEVADTVFPHLGLPGWSVRLVIALVGLGFPLALFLAWAFELTPDGIRRTADFSAGHTASTSGGRKFDVLIMIMLALAISLMLWDRFVPRSTAPPASAMAAEASIAVLPFVDMSAMQDQEYFGDGLSEEILNLLARIRELKVIGRTSSFAFKGKDVGIAEIGQMLGVAHVLEGSVRKSGDRIRITAQLILVDGGYHLWSESYDRRLADMFALQDEIASAIAAALRVQLVPSATERTANSEAYDFYLQARSLIHQRDQAALQQARKLIDRALALDPDYPPALAAAAETVILLSRRPDTYGDIPWVEARAQAGQLLQRALARDPESAEAHAVMGLMLAGEDPEAAIASLDRALTLNPSLANAGHWRASQLADAGQLREAISVRRNILDRDPLFRVNLFMYTRDLMWARELQAGVEAIDQLERLDPEGHLHHAARAGYLFSTGQLARAVDEIEQALARAPPTGSGSFLAGLIYAAIGDYPSLFELDGAPVSAPVMVAVGEEEQGLAQAYRGVMNVPDNHDLQQALFQSLSLARRHQELIDWVVARWGDTDTALTKLPATHASALMHQLALAQKALGLNEELQATLRRWNSTLEFRRDNGVYYSSFLAEFGFFHAVSGNTAEALRSFSEAMDLGYREPLLGRMLAVADLADAPAFDALLKEMRIRIDAERVRAGLGPIKESVE